MRRRPKLVRILQRLDHTVACPPGSLISRFVDGVMVRIAERNCELIGHLETHGAGLGKAQMVGVRRPAPANETGLCCDKGEVVLVAKSPLLGKGQAQGCCGLLGSDTRKLATEPALHRRRSTSSTEWPRE